MLRRVAALALSTLTALSCASRPRTPAPPGAPADLAAGCASPVYHRLDFWLGAWDVTTPDGAYDGTNFVEPALGGCAIEEHWLGADGGRGDSLFYVDRASGAWRQIWVTDRGPTKEKREEWTADGAIRFVGGRDRTTLTPLPDGRVRQVIEPLAGGAAWIGLYARIPKQCDAPDNHQFDFWLGDWTVRVKSRVAPDSEAWTEPAPGSNHVASIVNGCAIEERFTALGGKGPPSWSGRSHSTWVASEKRWRQTWVDDSGSYLAFTGGMVNGEMVLVGEPRDSGSVMRMVFADIGRDRFTWRWEASKDAQKSWKAIMTIEYVRQGPERQGTKE